MIVNIDLDKLAASIRYILLSADLMHVEKYARPVTGSLYLSETDIQCLDASIDKYKEALLKEIKTLANLDEIIEYLEQ